MALTEERKAEATGRRPPMTYILEGLGVAGALGTLALGLLGTLPEEPDFEVGREVFGNIPDAVVVVFYVTVAVFIWITFHLLARRSVSWQSGGPDRRTGQWGRRLHDLGAGLRMKTLMRDPQAGLMHSMIYFGFLVLFVGTVTLEIDHILPNLKFLEGSFYLGYSAILDLAALVYLGGLAWRFPTLCACDPGGSAIQDQAGGCGDPRPADTDRGDRSDHRGGSNLTGRSARFRSLVVRRAIPSRCWSPTAPPPTLI